MKNKIFTTLFLLCTVGMFGQEKSYQLSTYILDISTGQPAPDVRVELEMLSPAGDWEKIGTSKTDESGRINNFLPNSDGANMGIYKLTFYTAPYFEARDVASFYPFVVVVFEIASENHYHVPITLSPYGYSTYRGN